MVQLNHYIIIISLEPFANHTLYSWCILTEVQRKWTCTDSVLVNTPGDILPCEVTEVIFLCFRQLLCRRQPVLQHLHRQRFYTHQWFFVSEIHNASEQQSQDGLFIQLSCIITGPSTSGTAPWSSSVPESCTSSCRVQHSHQRSPSHRRQALV